KVREFHPADPAKQEALRASFPDPSQELFEIVCEAKFIELDPQQISAEIDGISGELEQNMAVKNETQARIDQQKLSMEHIEADLREREKTLSIYESQKKDVIGESDKLNEELGLVALELQEVLETLAGLKKSEEESSQQLDQLNQDLLSCQIRIREQQDLIAAKSQEREETTVAVAQLETEIQSFAEQRSGYDANLQMFSQAVEECRAEVQKIDEESGEFSSKKETYLKEIEDLTLAIDQLKEQKKSFEGTLSGYIRQREESTQKLNSVRASIASCAGETEDIKNQLHQLELNCQQTSFQEKEIRDRLMQTYRINLDEALAQMAAAAQQPQAEGQPQPAPVPSDPQTLQDEIERLRKRCESFGTVNLVAIEEFDELRGRFEFLTKQQSDLISAREQLLQTVQKINRQTRQMFMDTFTRVSEEFRIYFRMLFGGGEAQLLLLDPENVLESGIEIVARPPGKKLQNISLLSGGEKTLTAIALIFGVFKVNPSPFCVLDEIDAALDESNVGRFSYLLKDFSKIAQFIVITHNKKTIASANVMYGITMQETGVSKIVSVKFAEKKDDPRQEEVTAGV
ncbi:MAG: hypothetical protein U1D99_06940, partial [Candidatus Omnitrophota bacterium]|nr:hypothetical protein [Candidatus Omnitrophota bacterium]